MYISLQTLTYMCVHSSGRGWGWNELKEQVIVTEERISVRQISIVDLREIL